MFGGTSSRKSWRFCLNWHRSWIVWVGGQFYWWRKPKYPEKTIISIDFHFQYNYSSASFSCTIKQYKNNTFLYLEWFHIFVNIFCPHHPPAKQTSVLVYPHGLYFPLVKCHFSENSILRDFQQSCRSGHVCKNDLLGGCILFYILENKI